MKACKENSRTDTGCLFVRERWKRVGCCGE